MKHEKKICPKCGRQAVVPIVYGFPKKPIPTIGEDYVHGGCCFTEAQWACQACLTWFASDDGGQTLRPVKGDRGV